MDPLAKRIARRFVAGQQLDEKMKALLLKLRKGADASLTQRALFKVLALLGGWRVEEIIGLVPMHYMHDGEPQKESYAEEDEAAARAKYDDLKSKVVTHLPSNPQEGHEYVMDLEDLRSWEHSFAKGGKYHGAKYNAWVGAQGHRITDPQGTTFEMLPSRWDLERPSGRDRKKLTIYDTMHWLKTKTTYLAQINELLGMEEHVPAQKRTRDNTGTCAVCFRNIKIVQKGDHVVMALHGYVVVLADLFVPASESLVEHAHADHQRVLGSGIRQSLATSRSNRLVVGPHLAHAACRAACEEGESQVNGLLDIALGHGSSLRAVLRVCHDLDDQLGRQNRTGKNRLPAKSTGCPTILFQRAVVGQTRPV